MAAIYSTLLSRSELAKCLGHKYITGSLSQELADLMAAGLAKYTIPDKQNSRLEKIPHDSNEEIMNYPGICISTCH